MIALYFVQRLMYTCITRWANTVDRTILHLFMLIFPATCKILINLCFTGILTLRSKLDREKHDIFLVKVLASDNGSPARYSTASVSVTVQDINDNSPYFAPYSSQYTVPENAPVGTVICTLSAMDADLGEYGRVEYKFSYSNNDGNLKINRTSVSILL